MQTAKMSNTALLLAFANLAYNVFIVNTVFHLKTTYAHYFLPSCKVIETGLS